MCHAEALGTRRNGILNKEQGMMNDEGGVGRGQWTVDGGMRRDEGMSNEQCSIFNE